LEKRYYIEAVERAFRILEVFSQDKPSLTLTEIATKTGMSKGTAFRFIYTLEKLAYLEKETGGKHYRPGIRILKLGFTALKSMELSEFAAPFLKKLFDQCGENTNLAVLDGSQITYILRNIRKHHVDLNIQPGRRLPAHCTAMGKAMLSCLPKKEVEEILGPGPYEKMTPKTKTTFAELYVDLEAAFQKGYAITDEELFLGRRSIGSPIVGESGDILAAISISVPAHQYTVEEMEANLAPQVIKTASLVSLGFGSDREL
jgi:IclR family transcriptional regulator, pca regulon regulatory protein